MNVPRIKGSHNAMLSGMLAAEACRRGAGGGPQPRRTRRLRSRVARLADRQGPVEGAQRQAAVVEVRHHDRHRARRPRHVDQHARLLAVRHARSTASRTSPRSSRRPNARRSPIRGPTASSPSTGCRRCSCPTPITRKTSRCISRSTTWRCRRRPSTTSMAARRRAIARPASMNGSRRRATAIRHQRAELRPLQNLRHQGPEPEHHLGPAGGRRRAELSEYVR